MGQRPSDTSAARSGGSRRHWLDPLARQVLQATGQLPAADSGSGTVSPEPDGSPGAGARSVAMGSAAAAPSPLAQMASAAATRAAVGVLGAMRRQLDAALERIEPPAPADRAGAEARPGAEGLAVADALAVSDALAVADALKAAVSPRLEVPDAPAAEADRLAVERDLLALRLVQNPSHPLRSAEEVALAASLGWRLDVNRAQAADWRRLPGCTPAMVERLLRHQAAGLQLSGCEDLQHLLEIPASQVACWAPLLSFQWYGTPPPPPISRIPVNQASAATLATGLGLSEARCRRLLRERKQQPFLDLADLQHRLQLPADLLESWIGRVSFEPGPTAPGGLDLPRPRTSRSPRR